jgi:hypothetical protein
MTMRAALMTAGRVMGVHLHRRDTTDDAEPDLALPAHRLKGDGAVGAAPEDIGAEADA